MPFIVLLNFLIAQQPFVAGFDCRKAVHEVEHLICSDSAIGDLDLRLNNI
jgi:uncharacterized protein